METENSEPQKTPLSVLTGTGRTFTTIESIKRKTAVRDNTDSMFKLTAVITEEGVELKLVNEECVLIGTLHLKPVGLRFIRPNLKHTPRKWVIWDLLTSLCNY